MHLEAEHHKCLICSIEFYLSIHRIVLRAHEVWKLKAGEEEAKGKKDFLNLYNVIIEYNISIRMDMTIKWKLRDYIVQFESCGTNLSLTIELRDQLSTIKLCAQKIARLLLWGPRSRTWASMVMMKFVHLLSVWLFFRLHSTLTTHAHSHPYEHMYVNSTPMSIFEDWAGKSSRLTKLP